MRAEQAPHPQLLDGHQARMRRANQSMTRPDRGSRETLTTMARAMMNGHGFRRRAVPLACARQQLAFTGAACGPSNSINQLTAIH